MKLISITAIAGLFGSGLAAAQPSLTVYNQNFAVVRDRVALDLKAGENSVTYAGATLHLEPDSVVLRDPSKKTDLRILEQSYRAEVLSQGLLLSLNEGKELDFINRDRDGHESTVRGKVIRSGYTLSIPGNAESSGSPIIEVAGQLRFSLPGEPRFPTMGNDGILKPTLTWQLTSDRAAKLDAELSYVTGGMSWSAAYNLISPEKGDTLDIVGWVTIDNQSGTAFENASLKLMAGDVNKLQMPMPRLAMRADAFGEGKTAAVTEKAFDEFHLYQLPRATTLRNGETKQVEFLRATGVKTPTLYIYDGANIPWENYRGFPEEGLRNNREFGTQSNPKVWVMREFKNTKENGLGLPLPKGRARFYRQDNADGRPEFTGENSIDHTPQGETVRIRTGAAFDLVGSRTRSDYSLSVKEDQLEEAFEIKLRNRKKETVEIRVAERLYRWVNWEIVQKSDEYVKVDSRNIEFRVTLKPDEEKVVSYRVRYNWK